MSHVTEKQQPSPSALFGTIIHRLRLATQRASSTGGNDAQVAADVESEVIASTDFEVGTDHESLLMKLNGVRVVVPRQVIDAATSFVRSLVGGPIRWMKTIEARPTLLSSRNNRQSSRVEVLDSDDEEEVRSPPPRENRQGCRARLGLGSTRGFLGAFTAKRRRLWGSSAADEDDEQRDDESCTSDEAAAFSDAVSPFSGSLFTRRKRNESPHRSS